MSDIVEELRKLAAVDNCQASLEAAARIEQLEAENASLATWQCEFTDGKTGLVYGQGGTTFCIMAKRMQQLEAEGDKARARGDKLRMALEDIAYGDPLHNENDMMRIARAALEERT